MSKTRPEQAHLEKITRILAVLPLNAPQQAGALSGFFMAMSTIPDPAIKVIAQTAFTVLMASHPAGLQITTLLAEGLDKADKTVKDKAKGAK